MTIPTLRARLTLVYTGLFLLAGVVLLGTTYALFTQQLSDNGGSLNFEQAEPGQVPETVVGRTRDGRVMSGTDTVAWMEQEQRRLHDAATTSLITQGAIALSIVGLTASGLGYLISGRVLRPLHRVTETARRIADAPVAERGLHERINLVGPHDEVKDLADTFDTMVGRLDRSFDSQRHFIANASHELRTPLALNRALVEMAMYRSAASADVVRLGESLLEVNSRHERLITGLLILADAESNAPDPIPVDLADIAAQVVVDAEHEADKAGITVHENTGEAPTTGDAMLLERLTQNLVENGIRHNTGPGGHVTLTTRTRDENRVELEVSNSGPVVPAYEIPALFQPFRRLGGDRVAHGKGAGLGLSIVRAIAEAHHGDATAQPRPGGGLVVTVTLPRD